MDRNQKHLDGSTKTWPTLHRNEPAFAAACASMQLKPVYGQAGEILDFTITQVFGKLECFKLELGSSVVGRTFSEVFPHGMLSQNLQSMIDLAVTFPSYAELSLPPELGESEQPSHLVIYASDQGLLIEVGKTADPIESEVTAEENRRFIEKLASSLPEYIYVLDADETVIQYRNRDLMAQLGFPADPASKGLIAIQELVHPDDLHSYLDHRRDVLQTRDDEIIETTCRVQTATADWRWMKFRTSVFRRDENNVPTELLRTVIDVSAQIWTEMELREKVRQLRLIQVELKDRQDQLEKLNQKLASLATTDGLTTLYNYRAFQDKLDEEIRRARRHKHPLSLVICDIDDFKLFNDRLGHLAGDDRLRYFARVLKGETRACDFVARYGGEEFAIILVNTDVFGAESYAQGLVKRLNQEPLETRITASFGCVELEGTDKHREDLIARADIALYEAKRLGKNRVAISEPAITAISTAS